MTSVRLARRRALHSRRAAWNGTRTSRISTLRGLLPEQGIAIPAGAKRFVSQALDLVAEIRELERRIRESERRLEASADPTR